MALGVPFRHHPDGQIIIGVTIMELAEFMQVWPTYSGLPNTADIEGLPEGAKIIGREYIAGARHSVYSDVGGQHGDAFPWAEGDAITDALDQIKTDLDALRNPPPTLDESKATRKAEITADLNAYLALGFTTNAIKMDAGLDNVLKLDAGVRLAENLALSIIDIRDFDNVVHAGLAVADVRGMVNDLGANYQTSLSQKWALHDSIDAAADEAAVAAVVWV